VGRASQVVGTFLVQVIGITADVSPTTDDVRRFFYTFVTEQYLP
jgi:hypothetical protein